MTFKRLYIAGLRISWLDTRLHWDDAFFSSKAKHPNPPRWGARGKAASDRSLQDKTIQLVAWDSETPLNSIFQLEFLTDYDGIPALGTELPPCAQMIHIVCKVASHANRGGYGDRLIWSRESQWNVGCPDATVPCSWMRGMMDRFFQARRLTPLSGELNCFLADGHISFSGALAVKKQDMLQNLILDRTYLISEYFPWE